MKTTLFSFAALLGLVSAQNAVVNNHCATSVYVQSFPYDGSAPGPLTTVPSGGTFSEAFRASGSVGYSVTPSSVCAILHIVRELTGGENLQTVKIAKTKTLNSPLFFGYSFSSNPDYAYCERTQSIS